MVEKYDETPQQKLDRALNQPMQTNSDLLKERMIIEPNKEPYFMPLESIGLKDAFDRLCIELKIDKQPSSYYHSWQSNIAMAFCDAVEKYCADHKIPTDGTDKSITNEIANNAAKSFLDSLCNQ